MKYKIFLLKDAEEDLFEIYTYVAMHDTPNKAINLIDNIEATFNQLSEFPKRGHIPAELEMVSVYDYLEIRYKPYRIIYEIVESNVFIHCILDGRRDLPELLYERLLR
jgi:toxin ParE1/3/4